MKIAETANTDKGKQKPEIGQSRILSMLTSISLLSTGLSCGAMVLITLVLFPWLASLPLSEVRAWSGVNSSALRHIMYPLGTAATLSTVAAFLVGRAAPRRQRTWLAIAALAIVAMAILTLVFNEPINQILLGNAPVADSDYSTLLHRWILWNWVRVPFALLAFYAASRANRFNGIVFPRPLTAESAVG